VVRNVSKDFERFLTIFQDSKPLIHELHDEMTELLRSLLLRFVKPELVKDKCPQSLVRFLEKDIERDNFLPNDKIDIGSEASKTLKQLKEDSTQSGTYQSTCRDIKKMMEKCAAYVAKKLPFSNVLLKNIACLSPLLRTEPSSLQMIAAVVVNLPYCNSAEKSDSVVREWRKYQDEVIPETFFIEDKGVKDDGTAYIKYKRVDYYWHRVMQMTDNRGDPKYPTLAAVVKMALSLSHGQADVERGFSINKHILNDRSLLSEKVLCATRTVKEVLVRHGSVTSVPITPALIAAYRGAYKLYKDDLELSKTQKAQESAAGKRKERVDDQESIMKAKKRELEEKQAQAEKLINEGTERLTMAVQSNNLTDVLPSQALLQSGNKLLQECRTEIATINKQLEAGQHQPSKKSRPTNTAD
jgi:hypothetical protein